MWLGMLAAAAGQVSWLPVEPLSWLAGALAGYIAQIARRFGAPRWAQADIALAGPAALFGAYLVLGVATTVSLRMLARRRLLARPRPAAIVLAALLPAALVLAALRLPGEQPGRPDAGLRLTVLDVGQGDSILLEPAAGEPVLVDAGPAPSGAWSRRPSWRSTTRRCGPASSPLISGRTTNW